MRPLHKLLAVCLLVLPVFAVGSREASAGVCQDNLDFCLAGCTSSSPSTCRTKCYSQYRLCEQLITPGTKPTEGGTT